MKKYILSFSVLLIGLSLTRCDDMTNNSEIPEDGNGNFVLYVSNQSYAISSVDIKIYIDDMIAVNKEFDVGSQHNWKSFQFDLSTGEHKISIESKKGDASLEENFEIIDNKYWAVVDYWYYPDNSGGTGPTPKSFSFDIKDEPYLFQ